MKALVLIAVLVVVGVVILSRTRIGGSASPSTTRKVSNPAVTTTVPAPVTTTTVLPAAQVKVQVLNGVLTGSLAGLWSTKLKTKYGYITELPDNATAKVTSSIIYILTPGYQAEADQLATTVGLTAAAVDPTVPPPATAPIPAKERSTANLVLVIGNDLAGSA